MDEDPFAALLESLQSLFVSETIRQGRYTFAPVQTLKNCLENYDQNNPKTLIALVKAIRASMHHLDKWHIDINEITHHIDRLASLQNMPSPNWDKIFMDPKTTSRFQFSRHTTKEILSTWLSPDFEKLSPFKQTELVINKRDHTGFSQKLNAHLKTDPNFLFKLIMESKTNFLSIINTRLILYLTDQHLAKALIKYTPALSKGITDPVLFVEKVDGLLSNGRSVKALLRNKVAETILINNASLFKDYQSTIKSLESTQEKPTPTTSSFK